MSPLASDPFSQLKPCSDRPKTLSENPKTVANRKAIHSNGGLRIAYFRADSAFRAAKSRSLKALHCNANWSFWDDKQKQKAESDMIKKLEKKHDERKRKAEIALYAKWAKEELPDDEAVSDVPKAKKSRRVTKEKEDESVQESDCKVLALYQVRVQGSGFKVQGSKFRVQGSGFKVQGSRFRV